MAYSNQYKNRVSASLDAMMKYLASTENIDSEKLDKEVARIISSSRLEGHDEMADLAQNMKNVIGALYASKLLPAESINSTLKEVIDHMRTNLEGKLHDVDPSFSAKLKGLMKFAKSDERDFIFKRKISVLYIDDDEFAHISVKEAAEQFVDIISCYSGIEAQSLLASKKFDAVLCEMNLPDVNAIDLFKNLSSKLPVVAISTSDDPRQVQIATRAGAMDYIVKNDAGIRWIPRSLHTVANEWGKQRGGSREYHVLDDPDVKRLVLHMLQTGSPISQHITPRSWLDFTGDDSDKDYTRELQLLEEADYVRKEQESMNPSCSKCNSILLVARHTCPSCNNSNFTKGSILEHSKCGYTDFDSIFAQTGKENDGNKLICPKCNKELKLIGVDYFRTDSACKCRKCNNIFVSPKLKYTCGQCGNSGFGLSECSWVPFYTYWLDASKTGEIKSRVGSLELLKAPLESLGYQVQFGQKVEVEYNSLGPFDLVAYRKAQPNLVAAILGSDVEENHTKIMELETLGRSISLERIIIIMFSEPREVTRSLLDKFDMHLIVVEDEATLAKKFIALVKT